MGQESLSTGQAWGRDFAEGVTKKLSERGILMRQADNILP
jgi:hypothetical protein